MCCWPIRLYGNGKIGPNKHDLDAIVPDRPVWLTSDITHSFWVNSKALEVLGVDRNTPDPLPGVSFYVREENGEPNGWIKELYWQYGEDDFDVDTEAHEKGMTEFVNYLSRHGVTALYDAGNESHDDRVYAFMAKLDAEGRLPLRYEGTVDAFVPQQVDTAVAELLRLRRTYAGKRLRFNTIKLYMDGTNENRTGAVLEPYEDDPGNRGHTVLTVNELQEFLLELHQERIDLHIHVVGDRSVRIILDAVEAAGNVIDGDLYPRVTISHLDIIDPSDYPRIKELGVIANYTPQWHGVTFNDPVTHALGKERYARTLILKPLFDAGAIVTFSSDDWSDENMNPFLGMQVGHNRQFPAEWISEQRLEQLKKEGYDPAATRGPESERLDLALMIRGYTINGAYQLRMEDEIGSIETGKLADLVVLDDNLFEMDRYEILDVKPSAVIMEGELIHGALP
jgi:predicted amidohydrolase YtcJ